MSKNYTKALTLQWQSLFEKLQNAQAVWSSLLKNVKLASHLYAFALVLIIPALAYAQPDNITVSGCGNNNYNGVYNITTNTANGCNCYERDTDPDVTLSYISAFGGRWAGNTNNICGQQVYNMAGSDNDCDPTNGPAGIDGCTFLAGIVPVELTFFTAEERNRTTVLFWQTASEKNNDKFEIEESQDGRDFQKTGEVKGMGTSFEQQNYSYEIESPRNGISYYRLKQLDFDGQFEYSEIISVHFKGENQNVGEFYPNPSKSGLFNLDYVNQNNDIIMISVFDMTGKLLVNKTQQISNGNNNLSFDFSDLDTGSYIVKIGSKRNLTHRKLIIGK